MNYKPLTSKGAQRLVVLVLVIASLYALAPTQVAKLTEVGMCVSSSGHALKIKDIRFQDNSKTKSIAIEEISDSQNMLLVLLEGMGSSNKHGLYYYNWNGKLRVLSWRPVQTC